MPSQSVTMATTHFAKQNKQDHSRLEVPVDGLEYSDLTEVIIDR